MENNTTLKYFMEALKTIDEFAAFTGYTDLEEEGRWVRYDAKEEMTWAHSLWNPGEPNSWKGEEDCAIFLSKINRTVDSVQK